MRWVLAFATLVFLFAGCRGSVADDACPTHTFQLGCEVDKACKWNAKKKECSHKATETHDPCSVNMSAWYCDNDKTDKCDWDYKSAKCKRAKADTSDSQ
jgi:hypothetical protein